MDTKSLAHTRWEYKYHLVFAPKYRRQEIYRGIKTDIGQILSAHAGEIAHLNRFMPHSWDKKILA